jgi:hypothetical protein
LHLLDAPDQWNVPYELQPTLFILLFIYKTIPRPQTAKFGANDSRQAKIMASQPPWASLQFGF